MQIDGRIVRTYSFEVPRRLCNYLVSLASPEFLELQRQGQNCGRTEVVDLLRDPLMDMATKVLLDPFDFSLLVSRMCVLKAEPTFDSA